MSSFEKVMEDMQASWEKNPIPDDFKNSANNHLYCSVDGVKTQIDNLKSGQGIVFVAFVSDTALNTVEISQIPIFKS
jgi:hypothetical protein